MSDLRTILTGRTENTVTVVRKSPDTELVEPKIARIVEVVNLDADE